MNEQWQLCLTIENEILTEVYVSYTTKKNSAKLQDVHKTDECWCCREMKLDHSKALAHPWPGPNTRPQPSIYNWKWPHMYTNTTSTRQWTSSISSRTSEPALNHQDDWCAVSRSRCDCTISYLQPRKLVQGIQCTTILPTRIYRLKNIPNHFVECHSHICYRITKEVNRRRCNDKGNEEAGH